MTHLIAEAAPMVDIASNGFVSVGTLILLCGLAGGVILTVGGFVLLVYKINWTLRQHLADQREYREGVEKRQQAMEERQQRIDERQQAADLSIRENKQMIRVQQQEITKLDNYISESHQTNKLLTEIISHNFSVPESRQ